MAYQPHNPEDAALFRGRVTTFRTPGIAGTAGQKIFALHNATGSSRVVHINHIAVDMAQTVVKALTVLPPLVRIHRITTLPTGGTALTKVSKDTSLSASGSVLAWGNTASDGGASTALVATPAAGMCMTQEFAPRWVTAVGYEAFDRAEMLGSAGIVLRALEGIVVELAYVLATQNPVTDMWAVSCGWYEI